MSETALVQRAARRRTAECEVCILAGGASRRMKRDKAGLRLGRRTLLGLVQTTAARLGLPVRVIRRDTVPGCGPLGGIHTGLCGARASAVLFLACDMPFITVALLQALRARLPRHRQAVGVAQRGRISFPLVIRRAALPMVERRLRRGEWSIQSLAAALQAGRLRVPADRAVELCNINTPADWEAARAFGHKQRCGNHGRKTRLVIGLNQD